MLAITKQQIEITTFGLHILSREDRAEDALHIFDVFANANLPAAKLLDIGGGGQMIRMGMGFQDQRNRNPLLPRGFNQPISGTRIRFSAAVVPIQHRINDCSLARRRVEDQIADRIGRLIKKRLDAGAIRCG